MDRILEMLCALVADAQKRPTTESQRANIKLRLVDTVGCGVGGSVASPVQNACDAIMKIGGPGPCTVFNRGTAAVDRATFLNGYMQRYLDFNDSYLGLASLCHPSDMIAAALAVGEAEHRSGEELMRGIAAGYNAYCSLQDVASTYDRGWDLGFGATGAAVQTAVLLGLDESQTANAISLAVVPQSPLRQTRNGALSQWKGAAFANLAAHVVFAGYLARGGMTGPDQPFEGKYGIIAQVSGPIPLVLDYARDRTGEVDYKLAPVGHHAQAPVQLGIELRKRLGDFPIGEATHIAQMVKEVEIRLYKMALVTLCDTPDKWKPQNHETADHSIPFLFSLALAYGHLDEHDIDRALHDPAVFEITSRVKTIEDPAFNKRFPPEAPVAVDVKLASGETTHIEASAPLGSTTRKVGVERISQKFHDNSDSVIGRERADKLEKRLFEVDKLSDVAGLLAV